MKRRVAWTRLTALALSTCLVVHATIRALSRVWLGEAAAALEVAAAVLMARHGTRSIGVIVGAAILSLSVMAALLAGEFSATLEPLLLVNALLALGRRLDRERNGRSPAPRRKGEMI